jgi:hypothetical protein
MDPLILLIICVLAIIATVGIVSILVYFLTVNTNPEITPTIVNSITPTPTPSFPKLKGKSSPQFAQVSTITPPTQSCILKPGISLNTNQRFGAFFGTGPNFDLIYSVTSPYNIQGLEELDCLNFLLYTRSTNYDYVNIPIKLDRKQVISNVINLGDKYVNNIVGNDDGSLIFYSVFPNQSVYIENDGEIWVLTKKQLDKYDNLVPLDLIEKITNPYSSPLEKNTFFGKKILFLQNTLFVACNKTNIGPDIKPAIIKFQYEEKAFAPQSRIFPVEGEIYSDQFGSVFDIYYLGKDFVTATSDSNKVYVYENEVFQYAIGDGKEDSFGSSLKWGPEGRLIIGSPNNNKVYIYNDDGTLFQTLTPHIPCSLFGINLATSDGSYLAIATQENSFYKNYVFIYAWNSNGKGYADGTSKDPQFIALPYTAGSQMLMYNNSELLISDQTNSAIRKYFTQN